MMNEYFTQRQSNPPNTDTQWKKKISSMKWIHTITLNNTQNITTKYTNKLKFTAVIIHVCMVVYNRHFTAGDYCSTTKNFCEGQCSFWRQTFLIE